MAIVRLVCGPNDLCDIFIKIEIIQQINVHWHTINEGAW